MISCSAVVVNGVTRARTPARGAGVEVERRAVDAHEERQHADHHAADDDGTERDRQRQAGGGDRIAAPLDETRAAAVLRGRVADGLGTGVAHRRPGGDRG